MQLKSILLVDDDPDDTEFFKSAVEQIDPGIKVSTVGSNKDLFLHLDQHTPHLLFIDSFILHESGIECIQSIRKNPKFEHLPIIMYTGSGAKKNIVNAFAAGASAYIVKPASLAEIKSVLQLTFQQDWDNPLHKQYYLGGEFHVFEQ